MYSKKNNKHFHYRPHNNHYNILVPVLNQKKICPNYFKLIVKCDSNITENLFPGQFIAIKCGNNTFLRRPFSVANIINNQIEIIYKVVGPGTEWLSKRKPADKLDILCPLGNGFDLSSRHLSACNSIFIAGGTGIVSLMYLAHKISRPGILFYGTKTKKDIVCTDIFKKLGWEIKLATEDGSSGYKGLITDLLGEHLSTRKLPATDTCFYSCGPYAMLREVSKLCKKHNIKCYVSLEEMIACGIGACRGCVVRIRSKESKNRKDEFEYKTVCKDGPVFNANEIVW